MELRQLRYFVTLAGELHFGRAAKRLALTQPPLTQAIQKLERELGVRLFERTQRRVALTHAGKAFLEEARHTLARADGAVDRAQRASRGEVGRLAVGFLANTAYTLLPLVLRDFTHSYPGVTLDLRELTNPQQLGALRRVPLRRLAGESFVMFPRTAGFVFHDLIMGFCQRAGFAPRVAQEVNQTHAVIGLVSAGLGVALVPASAQKIALAGVEYRPLREATPLAQVSVAWRRADASPVVAAFLQVARLAARNL